jgi:hypothetical protein
VQHSLNDTPSGLTGATASTATRILFFSSVPFISSLSKKEIESERQQRRRVSTLVTHFEI